MGGIVLRIVILVVILLAHSAPMALAPHWRAGLLRQVKAYRALTIALIIP